MGNRAKRQHFVPRFYLRSFANSEGRLWTHDSLMDTARQTAPEETGLEGNIYSPTDENGARIDFIDNQLEIIEDVSAPILKELLAFRRLDDKSKSDFASFLATMFGRSPAQLRQFARAYGEMSDWAASHALEKENRQKSEQGVLTKQDTQIQEIFQNKKQLSNVG